MLHSRLSSLTAQVRTLIAGTILVSGSLVAAQASFSTQRNYSPIRMSQDELLALTNRVDALAKTANIGVNPDRVSRTLDLGDGRSAVSFTGTISLETLASAPPVATNVSYRYRGDLSGPITLIWIYLTDSVRLLTVEGSAQDQVEAVTDAVATRLDSASTLFAGPGFRLLGTMAFLVGGLLVSGLAVATEVRIRWISANPGRHRTSSDCFHFCSLGAVVSRGSGLSRRCVVACA